MKIISRPIGLTLLLTPMIGLNLSACIFRNNFKILANYNGQSDLLLSLQIPPDYYPLQFKEKSLRDYLKNPQNYIITNQLTSNDKNIIKNKIHQRFSQLLGHVTQFGPSLWNNAIYNSGDVSRNVEFWTMKKVALMFMERFVLDDFKSVLSSAVVLPSFQNLIETNFRASRDPFTTFSKNVFDKIEQIDDQATDSDTKLSTMLSQWLREAPDEDPDALYRYASYMRFWKKKIEENKDELKKAGYFDWIVNYPQDTKNHSTTSPKDNHSYSYQPVFYPEKKSDANQNGYDKKLAAMYAKVILDEDSENKLKNSDPDWKLNYLNNFQHNSAKERMARQHHPAFEQQADPGSSPAAEGSQRDTMVYLYQLANGINEYVKNFRTEFETNFKGDFRKEFLENALHNVSLIGRDMKQRLKDIRTYFQQINVVDKNYDPEKNKYDNTQSKVLSIVTYPPTTGGAGNATIQTISKFAFIYHDIGLKQVLPVELPKSDHDQNSTPKIMELDYTKENSVKYAGYHQEDYDGREKGSELFNIDDNGWWWNLGDGNKDTVNLKHFVKTSDTVIITATTQDWTRITGNDQSITSGAKVLSSIAKTYDYNSFRNSDINVYDHHTPNSSKNNKYPVNRVEYGLWNEGLRSPFSVNMVLDQLVNIIQNQYDHDLFSNSSKLTTNSSKTDSNNKVQLYQKAMDWGDYWKDYFIQGKSYKTYPSKTN